MGQAMWFENMHKKKGLSPLSAGTTPWAGESPHLLTPLFLFLLLSFRGSEQSWKNGDRPLYAVPIFRHALIFFYHPLKKNGDEPQKRRRPPSFWSPYLFLTSLMIRIIGVLPIKLKARKMPNFECCEQRCKMVVIHLFSTDMREGEDGAEK